MDADPLQKAAARAGIALRLRLARGAFQLDVDLELPGQGVTALLGPSGSGKTTVLRCLAGLERAPLGQVVVQGQVWQDAQHWLPAHRRPVGYVFQDANLFPHLSVRHNLLYGERRLRRDEVRAVTLEQAVELLGIGHLMDRLPAALSGGERQRAAIARALLCAPRLLLMDEPLASLDAARKAEVLPYLQRLQAEVRLPVVYVTHALDEAARLADHLVLLDAGRVRRHGPVLDLLADLGCAAGWGDEAGAVMQGVVTAHDAAYGLSQITVRGGVLWVPALTQRLGQAVRTRVLARDVSLATQPPTGSTVLNILPARVQAMQAIDAATVLVRLTLSAPDAAAPADAGETVLARITRRSADELALQPGQAVWVQIKGVALIR